MFENKNINQSLSELDVDASTGLTSEEASKRLVKHGFNKLSEKKRKPLILVFLSQFNDPMIFILFAAAILSIGISLWSLFSPSVPKESKPDVLEIVSDPVIILSVCVLNAIIGTVQENKAEKSLEALKKLASPLCLVRRDGKISEIKTEELVPGDIVILEEGRTIPADLRLIETHNLKTNESSLTGESLPIEKNADFTLTEEVGVGDRINCAYMSTPVVYGRGEGVVVATGMNTETGKIAKLLSMEEDNDTPLQKKLAQLSKFLGILTIVIVLVIFATQLIGLFVKGFDPATGPSEIANDVMLSISLAVAAIPEGLPAVVTIVLALGVQRMVKANTIVRKLPSVETLGSVSVVCSDKTGTLTQNKMTVVKAYIDDKIYENNELLATNLHELSTGLSLCSNATTDNGGFGDPTEIALVDFANKHKLYKADLEIKYPRVDEYPFDSVRKMMSTKHSDGNAFITFTKGALDSIIDRCNQIQISGKYRAITKEDKEKIYEASNIMSNDALRVLALAKSYDGTLNEKDMIFIGLVGMIDPPREEARAAVNLFKRAGITTIMITGDHKSTALAIAKQLNIAEDESQAISGSEIDAITFDELKEKVKTVRIFARVSPENKVSIVNAIKANGNIAAMTGDGVNDAPSLKAADIGIAMGITGTDVAKGAADMILIDDNFASIEKAVEEGRGIYTNIKKTVLFLLGSNISEVLSMFVVVIISMFSVANGLPTPLLSVHVLFVNLVTDSIPAIALGADDKDPNIMDEKPRSSKESLFSHGGYAVMIGYGVVITVATLAAFFFAPFINHAAEIHSFADLCNWLSPNGFEASSYESSIAQTCAFCVLSFAELFHMLGMTSIRKSFVHNFKSKNKLIWIAIVSGLLLQFGVVMIPGINDFFKVQALDLPHWLFVLGLSLSPLVVHEIVALILFIKNKKKNK